MPSIKAVLVSLALSALALAPVAQASPVKADEVLARRSPSFFSNEGAVEKRSESRKDLAARVKRAKLAAARKVKRQRTTWGQRAAAAAPVSAPAASSNGGEYAAGSPFLSTPQALAAAAVRCGSNFICNARTTPPANAAALCLSGRCTFRCNQGFAPGGADGTQCVASAPTCGTETCATIEGGYATCSGNTCVYGCNAGLSLITSGSTPLCVNLLADPNNCGAVGTVCPASYNGLGTPACRNGLCRLNCPAGSYERSTTDGSGSYCYGA
ncbi:hypothetical protein JCM8115_007021 [Rhodotorula mucilaginosa]|uniref:Uncharacterized protein n=1 Tax=Rhodotorula mucilaginosa TaxID=5537 RepID=A0A9P6W6X8_RHOMI|nr:hypothetical protein C6P46_001487 [Rhodotorula mucilaginosa]TKA57084.1 hypothetical protein B0A53_01040 [Rhodotorula sp. CCFEE 5036]